MLSEGWVSTPNVRGTFDILWTCLQTVALCAWTSVCVNLPSPDDGPYEMLRDRFHFTLLALLGPDLVFLLAYTQLMSARASVRQFKATGRPGWTLKHAFYADMGGISVKPTNWKRFPVNATQLHFLIVHGCVEFPKISEREIEARGKTDGLGRVITIGQTLFFTITTFARITQGLGITTLELTTLGFVFCTLATSICWWHKPNSVEIGHTFELSQSMEDILKAAGVSGHDVTGTYRDTPLDFVTGERWAGNVLWPFYVNILRRTRLFPNAHICRPIQRISSFNFPKPSSRYSELLVLWLGLSYAATFFAAWNFYFPSDMERILWRIFATTQCAISAVVGIFEVTYYTWPANPREFINSPSASDVEKAENTKGKKIHLWLQKIRDSTYNNSASKHPFYDVPLRSVLITTPLCATYCICRWFLLLEDLIGLRSVPSSTFQTVNWTQYLPSF